MPAEHPHDIERPTDGVSPPSAPARAANKPPHLLPRYIRAEANLLRLPLFALDTKRLKTLDGIQCKGSITRDGETHQFTLKATRNTATLYPGPLARDAHMAFLSLASEASLPLQNPISWSWRDLCRRMDMAYAGRTVLGLKRAIRSTALLAIQSEYAIYSKAERRMLCTRDEALHLYERVSFVGGELPDGTKADANYLWFSDWYLQNINAMFTAPIDYELWRFLDKRSFIASRLYEFLLLNFYKSLPVLRINYGTLAQFLPIKAERFRSLAQQRLEPAIRLLDAAGLARVEWCNNKAGDLQLAFRRGERLIGAGTVGTAIAPRSGVDFTEALEVEELRNLKPPEWSLVADFYRLWASQEQHQPTTKELDQARQLLEQYGPAKAKGLIPLVAKKLKHAWPDAKTFGAVSAYAAEAANEFEKQERRAEQEEARQQQERLEQAEAARKAEQRAKWKLVWETLPESEQDAIRSGVLKQYRLLARTPRALESACLDVLASRHPAKNEPTEHDSAECSTN